MSLKQKLALQIVLPRKTLFGFESPESLVLT